MNQVIANGNPVAADVPWSLEEFLIAQKLPPRSVVVEHNGEAVAPSEFPQRRLQAQDRIRRHIDHAAEGHRPAAGQALAETAPGHRIQAQVGSVVGKAVG